MARSYIKDKKITILKKESNSGPMPGETEVPIQGGENIWAYYRYASANEVSIASTIGYKVEAVFRINWRDDLTYDMKVRFRGQDYEIKRIDDFEGYKRDITIHANTLDN